MSVPFQGPDKSFTDYQLSLNGSQFVTSWMSVEYFIAQLNVKMNTNKVWTLILSDGQLSKTYELQTSYALDL